MTFMKFSAVLPLCCAMLCSLMLISPAQAQQGQPNIVFILADDLGYGDVQPLNPQSKIATPNFNRLAKEGMTFTDAHSPSAVCTPTRYATLTGRYCWRSSLKRGVLNGYGRPLIEADRPTVASHLQTAGYRTACVGKWHLGLGFVKKGDAYDWSAPLTYSPVDAGFEYSYVIPASLDFPPYVYIDGHRITEVPDRTQPAQKFPAFLRKGELGADFSIVDSLDHLTDKATTYIKQQQDAEQPFFLYFPLTAPHKPVMPHPRFEGKSGLGPYGDFVMQVDSVVGRVLDALDESDLANETVVMVTSDNGSYMYRETDAGQPAHVKDPSQQAYYQGDHTANGPWRGTKADIWEGGHRVPFFARWPGKIAAGSTCDQPICHVDLFATAGTLAKKSLPSATVAAPDSFSLTPLFMGQNAKFKRAAVINHSAAGMFAVRSGPWKLVVGNGSGGREKPSGRAFTPPWELYNLEADPTEEKNVYHDHPQVAAELLQQLMLMFANERSR